MDELIDPVAGVLARSLSDEVGGELFVLESEEEAKINN